MLVICALILHGEKAGRTVHLVYGSALRNWSECADLYNVRVNTDASTGQTVVEASLAFLYPPSFLVLYKPFTWFPAPWGELAWRVLAACLLAACLAIGSGRANLAGTWLALGIAIKPILLAPAALAIVLLPSCLPPLLVVLGLLLASPFLTAPTAYVLKQYGLFLQQTFGPCLNVSEDRFADLNGLLRGMGLEMRAPFSTVVRAGVGLSMAAWMLRARRRLGRVDAALLWLAVSSAYLMLFNPMTEANSYCMLSVPMALCAWRWIDAGRRWVGWSLLASVPAMACAAN